MRRRRAVLPGFRLTMGFTVFYLCLIVLVPLLTLPIRTASLGWDGFWRSHHRSARGRVVPAYARRVVRRGLRERRLRVSRRLGAGPVRVPGTPHRRCADRSAVRAADGGGGITLTALYAPNGWLGRAARAARNQGRVHAARHHDRADLHRAAVRRAHAAAGHRRPGSRGRGGGDQPRGRPCCRCSCASSCPISTRRG